VSTPTLSPGRTVWVHDGNIWRQGVVEGNSAGTAAIRLVVGERCIYVHHSKWNTDIRVRRPRQA